MKKETKKALCKRLGLDASTLPGTFEDACKFTGDDPTALPDVSKMPPKHGNALIALAKLFVIINAINGKKTPTWKDGGWWYQPWFNMNSGSGLSYLGFVNANSTSGVGSRLCYKSREHCEYGATMFIGLYQDYMLIK